MISNGRVAPFGLPIVSFKKNAFSFRVVFLANYLQHLAPEKHEKELRISHGRKYKKGYYAS
jgi:hypothetical protein